ncbi:hypothetical protein BGZ94_002283 [Podila epigama]|nr:hypothetical protein BGZ94_002283 [Podila epigama]
MATPSIEAMSSRRPLILASTFTCACLNMLVAGSLYVYALYAPSFKSHLHYTQTQTSTIAVIGDLGLYGVGPLTGRLADSIGPKRTSFIAGTLLLVGYGLLSIAYSQGVERVERGEFAVHFLAMSFFLFLAGIGASACYMAAFTTLAKSFKQARGIAMGIPVSFFGLSAAALAIVAQSFFMVDGINIIRLLKERVTQELDAGRFLLFLALSGGVINGLSALAMNVVPSPNLKDDLETDHDASVTSASASASATMTPSLQDQETMETDPCEPTESSPLLSYTTPSATIIAKSSTSLPTTTSTATATNTSSDTVASVSGTAFFLDRDAQYFFIIMICLTGSGLMIINSISAIVESVAAGEENNQSGIDEIPVATIQATHVALISISSYVARLVTSFGSDMAIRQYQAHRIYVVPITTTCMALAQVVAMFASLRWLYLCSMLTGFAYGGFFGIAGTIVAELWGEATCGQNWGFLSWGSAIGGMLFNVLFGVVMDSSRTIEDTSADVCKGHRCFRPALFVSFAACTVSLCVSLIMCARRNRQAQA